MAVLANGIDYIDLEFQGRRHVIATAILREPGGVALIDPGPSICLPVLRARLHDRALSVADIRTIVLTHIHLDHAGATGSLLHENPDINVTVHEVGGPHLIDPARLLSSAGRLYGPVLEQLWGPVLPVPAPRVRTLVGGERITVGGRDLEVLYTPGHARHHVSFFDRVSGVAFIGDTAGIRRPDSTYVMPPTPPPDIDLPAWRTSMDRILAWQPDTLFLTHFGPFHDARAHLDELRAHLDDWSGIVRGLLRRDDLTDHERSAEFSRDVLLDLRRKMPESETIDYNRAGRLDFSWQGLSRYWRKHGSGAGG